MSLTLKHAVTLEFEAIECANCGAYFGLTTFLVAQRREDGNRFFCPNGHPLSFNGEFDRLKKALKAAEKDAAALREELHLQGERAERMIRERNEAQKAVRTLNRRVAHGVCPCCHRTFKGLARHMANKHPDFVKENP